MTHKKPPSQPDSTAEESAARSFDFLAWIEAGHAELVFFRVNASNRLEFVSASVRAILGYESAEMLARDYRDFFDLDHRLCAQLLELSSQMLTHDSPELIRCVAQRRDGQFAFFLLRERRLHDAAGAYVGKEVMAQDVTRRVEAELWLRQSERKYRRLVEGFRGDYVIYTRNAQGLLTYVSPSVETVLGYPRDEVLGRNWREVVGAGRDNGPTTEIRDRAIDDLGRQIREIVIEIPRRDGSLAVLEVQEWAIIGVDGRRLAMEGIAKDVTAARQAELEVRELKDDLERRVALRTEELSRINEDLRASEARYRNVVETQSEFIVRWKADGTRTFVNDAYCRFVGCTPEAALRTTLVPTLHPEDRHLVAGAVAILTPEEPTRAGECRLFNAQGETRWTQWYTQAYFDDAGRPVEYQSVGRDVTELKEAADQLRQKEAHLAHLSRLATMGEMVAGIAHELSQPLHAAKTFAEAARRHLESGRPGNVQSAMDCSNEISQAVVRTVEIIRRLREFTKASPVKIEALDLNEVVRGALDMMAYEIRRVGSVTQLDLAHSLPVVRGDRIQLEQVCVNLLKNACDALDGMPLARRTVALRTSAANGGVRLDVRDSGCGVASADAARLFDAFYSTKPDGMGMGLSLCKSIAEAHNMQIGFFPNDDGRGTTFFVTLPVRVEPDL